MVKETNKNSKRSSAAGYRRGEKRARTDEEKGKEGKERRTRREKEGCVSLIGRAAPRERRTRAWTPFIRRVTAGISRQVRHGGGDERHLRVPLSLALVVKVVRSPPMGCPRQRDPWVSDERGAQGATATQWRQVPVGGGTRMRQSAPASSLRREVGGWN